jgi:hypothetical protein
MAAKAAAGAPSVESRAARTEDAAMPSPPRTAAARPAEPSIASVPAAPPSAAAPTLNLPPMPAQPAASAPSTAPAEVRNRTAADAVPLPATAAECLRETERLLKDTGREAASRWLQRCRERFGDEPFPEGLRKDLARPPG